MKRAWVVAVALLLLPTTVSADELRIYNTGGVEVTVWSDSGDTVTAECGSGICAVGVGDAVGDGAADVASATTEGDWLIIHADNITAYEVTLACNQSAQDVEPQVELTKDAPPVTHERHDNTNDDRNRPEPYEWQGDWSGQEYWLYT